MSASMTSRERVLLTINHREPDRIPFDITFTAGAYHQLRQHLGLPPDPDIKVGIWADVAPKLDLLDAMGIDFIYLGLNTPATKSPLVKNDGLLYDQWGIGRKKVIQSDGYYYYEAATAPLANPTLESIRSFPWPDPYDPARRVGVREKFEQARRETDKAIIGRFATSIWEQATYLCGLQSWLETLALQPEIACAVLDKTCEIAMGMADVGIETVGDLIDVYRYSGEDMGAQNNPIISPKMYQLYVLPRFQRYWGFVRQKLAQKNPAARTMIHSCGAIRMVIPSWIEMGLHILDPIQPQARGMAPEGLKQDFGEQLTFHGGIDIQNLLPNGSREQVMAEVQHYIRALGKGGGYIVSPAHNVQSDVPPQNLIAMREAVERYGYYPLE